jgi:hypothetical protein
MLSEVTAEVVYLAQDCFTVTGVLRTLMIYGGLGLRYGTYDAFGRNFRIWRDELC